MSDGSLPRAVADVRRLFLSPHLIAFLGVVIFAANFVVVRGVHEQYPPAALSLWRWATPTVVLLPFVWRSLPGQWAAIRRHRWALLACAVLMPIVGALFGYLAMAHTVAVNGAIFQSMIPVFVALLSWVLAVERLRRRQALGLVLAIGGGMWLVTRGDLRTLLALEFNAGDMLLLASALGLAGYTVLVKHMADKPGPLVLLFVICGAGSIFHLPFVAFEVYSGAPFLVNAETIPSIVFAAVFPSLLAVMFYNHAVEKLGPSRASAYHYLLPVVTAALAYLFLGETLRLFHVAGTALIIVGVYNATRRGPAAINPGGSG